MLPPFSVPKIRPGRREDQADTARLPESMPGRPGSAADGGRMRAADRKQDVKTRITAGSRTYV